MTNGSPVNYTCIPCVNLGHQSVKTSDINMAVMMMMIVMILIIDIQASSSVCSNLELL